MKNSPTLSVVNLYQSYIIATGIKVILSSIDQQGDQGIWVSGGVREREKDFVEMPPPETKASLSRRILTYTSSCGGSFIFRALG